jgi:hypothetical protein
MSSINFTCPHCSFQKQLPASAEGMQGNCPSCKAVVTIRADAPANPSVLPQQPVVPSNPLGGMPQPPAESLGGMPTTPQQFQQPPQQFQQPPQQFQQPPQQFQQPPQQFQQPFQQQPTQQTESTNAWLSNAERSLAQRKQINTDVRGKSHLVISAIAGSCLVVIVVIVIGIAYMVGQKGSKVAVNIQENIRGSVETISNNLRNEDSSSSTSNSSGNNGSVNSGSGSSGSGSSGSGSSGSGSSGSGSSGSGSSGSGSSGSTANFNLSGTYELGNELTARLTAANIGADAVVRSSETGSSTLQDDIDIMKGFQGNGYLKARFNAELANKGTEGQGYILAIDNIEKTLPNLNNLKNPVTKNFEKEIATGGLYVFIENKDLKSKSTAEKAIRESLKSKSVGDLVNAAKLRNEVEAIKQAADSL